MKRKGISDRKNKGIGIKILFGIIGCFLLITGSPAAATEEIAVLIAELNNQIAAADSSQEKARLCCFRARNYLKMGDMTETEQSYLEALEYDYNGWILNEYCSFLYRIGAYGRAYRAALEIEQRFPHFRNQVKNIKKKARLKYEEAYLADHPPLIIMDTEVDPYRVTRHDLIRKQGLNKPFVVYSRNRVSKQSTTSTAAKPAGKRIRRS